MVPRTARFTTPMALMDIATATLLSFALLRRAPQMLTVRITHVTTGLRIARYTTGKMDTATVIRQLSVPASHARLTTTVRETLVIMVLHTARSMTPVLNTDTATAMPLLFALRRRAV
ncbi:hypothetical protein DPMN_118722 [Dreissena polymorpha]|uniref:Uncharacterized protein n=1 Tax=Dreissena polymorpha TaxID=45954 RepID=A0A9D4JRC3_DREPO|nr:hypothetical protein DPMN_118722 [Dreissena polymorpha]